MSRLGYTRYVAQGGDVGALVTDLMGRQAVEGLAGYHLNLLTAVLAVGDQLPKESEQEQAAAAAVATFRESGFALLPGDGKRPQTIGYALLDSPRRPGGLDARSRHGQLLQDLPRLPRRRARGQSHPGDDRRQHHAVLADGTPASRRPGRTGRTHERWPRRLRAASLLRRSPCRSASPPSPARSGRRPGAGSRRSTRASPTSTRPTGAATSPHGKSRNSSQKRFGRRSGHCANRRTWATCRICAPPTPCFEQLRDHGG